MLGPFISVFMAFVYGISVYPTDISNMIMRWWSVAPIGWSIVHYSITVLQSWNIKKIKKLFGFSIFLCVCCERKLLYDHIDHLLLPPEVFTSSWSWVCFHWPPDIQLNSGRMRCDVSSTGDAQWRRSLRLPRGRPSLQTRISMAFDSSLFPSREQNGFVNVSDC